ncbi:MAG: SRPBCC family protein [Phycisphaerae bacterium]|nr:SRPBCC family protein [Gemmatimonadaceae bacterium]
MKQSNPLSVTAEGEREIKIVREFDAPRQLIYDCHMKEELVRQWLLGPPGWTMPVCEIDARVGGKYRYVWRKSAGEEMGMGGVFKEISEPERIVSTQLFDQDWTGGETLGTMVLTETNGRTKLEQIVLYPSKKAREGALSTGMTQGMEMGYQKLDALLDSL